MSITFSERLQAAKAKASPTSLFTFLLIYSKAERECGLNYNEGTKALYNWLKPIELPVKKYPEINIRWAIPTLVHNWEMSELAGILAEGVIIAPASPYRYAIDASYRWQRAIMLVAQYEVLPLLLPVLPTPSIPSRRYL